MKRLLFVLLATILSVPVFSQTVGFRDDSEKILAVGSNYMLTKPWGSYSSGVALAVYTEKESGQRKFDLGIYFETYGQTFCQEHSRAIFKTFSGSIITLEQWLETSDVQNSRERVGDYRSTTYSLTPHYIVPEDVLNKLMEEGIEVMRIETLKGLKDFTYKSDVLGAFLTKEYNLILGKQDFGTDF